MVIEYSYGKHCSGFLPGQTPEAIGLNMLDIYKCPDRTDCDYVNGDAILMAGYLCHPCIPNPCGFTGRACLDSKPYTCRPGFECPIDESALLKAQAQPFCNPAAADNMLTGTSTGMRTTTASSLPQVAKISTSFVSSRTATTSVSSSADASTTFLTMVP